MKMQCKHRVLIAGHRGNPSAFPENTMEAFRSAVEVGADMLETDVRFSADGELVLMHDASTLRTTGHDGLIGDMTLDELKALYVGEPSLGCRVPTLRELLAYCRPIADLTLDIEVKSEGDAASAAALVDAVVALCREYGLCERVMLNSFDYQVLDYCHRTYGNIFVYHGYYPYTKMRNVTGDPTAVLDYACFWADGEEAKAACDFLLSHGIEPCTGSRTTESAFYEKAALGCSMFTENDPASAVAWRGKIEE